MHEKRTLDTTPMGYYAHAGCSAPVPEGPWLRAICPNIPPPQPAAEQPIWALDILNLYRN